jgi:hypothetical protein
LQADPEAYKVAYEQYEQYQAQLAAYEAQSEKAEEPEQRRPDWLQEIAAKSQRRSPPPDESPAEPEPAQAVGPDGRVWDERWGYCTPEQLRKINSKGKGKGGDGKGKGKGKGGGGGGGGKSELRVVSGKGGHYAVPSSAPVGPPKRGYKLQRCPKWGQHGKCKKGWHCPFAHGDHELAPKEVRTQVNKQQREQQEMIKQLVSKRDDEADDEVARPQREVIAPSPLPPSTLHPNPSLHTQRPTQTLARCWRVMNPLTVTMILYCKRQPLPPHLPPPPPSPPLPPPLPPPSSVGGRMVAWQAWQACHCPPR